MKITKFLVDGQEAAVSKTALDTDVTGSLLPTPAAPVEENPSTDAGKVPTVANNGTYQLTTPSSSAPLLIPVTLDSNPNALEATGGATGVTPISESELEQALRSGRPMQITFKYTESDEEVLVVSTALSGHAAMNVADYYIDEKAASYLQADPGVLFTTSGSTTTVTMNPADSG